MIRAAKTEDFDTISKLLQGIAHQHHEGRPDIFKDASQKYSFEDFTGMLSDDTRPVFVYEDDATHEVFAYAFCQILTLPERPVAYARKYLYLDDLFVSENLRGRGIGREIMNFLIKFAKGQDCSGLELNVWEFNKRAIEFYERLGLTAQRRQMEIKII